MVYHSCKGYNVSDYVKEERKMSIEQMRGWLKQQYHSAWKWVNKVNAMSDSQVIAVYYRLSRSQK